MSSVSLLKLPPLELGGETIGQAVARLRKERGYTQAELAEKVGIIQTIVSAIETNALRFSAEDGRPIPARARSSHQRSAAARQWKRFQRIAALPERATKPSSASLTPRQRRSQAACGIVATIFLIPSLRILPR